MPGLITMDDLSNDEILSILTTLSAFFRWQKATYFAAAGKILGNLFLNPAPERVSFETVMKRLGGDVVNLETSKPSVVKGETLFDTIQMVDGYTDIIAMRHPRQGAAHAQDAARVPILNGGDGAGHHPTQTMLDLFTIRQAHGRLDGLKVILAATCATAEPFTLSHALTRFGCELVFASPELLKMPKRSWRI